MPLEELLAELQDYDSRGFVAYVNHIDAEVAREIPCVGCGGEAYTRGRAKFVNGRMVEYHCWACCEQCNTAEEF